MILMLGEKVRKSLEDWTKDVEAKFVLSARVHMVLPLARSAVYGKTKEWLVLTNDRSPLVHLALLALS